MFRHLAVAWFLCVLTGRRKYINTHTKRQQLTYVRVKRTPLKINHDLAFWVSKLRSRVLLLYDTRLNKT